jgi:hypothetical protein
MSADGNDTPRHPGGRPSKYDPAFCERVIAMGSEGKGVAEWASAFGVAKGSIYAWKDQHPEFLDACMRAETECQSWWENAGRIGMVSDKFNATVWQKNMNCRFRDDWRDQTDVNLKVTSHEKALDALG